MVIKGADNMSDTRKRERLIKSLRRRILYRGCRRIVVFIKKNLYFAYTNSIRDKIEVIDHKIAIMTNTNEYNCNPKYIYKEIKKRDYDWDVVWLVDQRKVNKTEYPPESKIYSIYSKKGIESVYSAKIWLDNGVVFSNYFDKKEDQIHIQTMHGSLGIKRLDNAIIARNKRGKEGKKVVFRETNYTDYVITNSLFEEEVFQSVFWKNTPMIRLGHARTDILFSSNQKRIEDIRKKLWQRYGVQTRKKIVLYAPTHRKGMTEKDVITDYSSLAQILHEKFGGEYVILIRMHKRTKDIFIDCRDRDKNDDRITYDVTDYPDIQELMLVADIGITDYSSWIYDYLLTRRPGFLFATDLVRYNNNTGLYYRLEETPFPVSENEKELLESIMRFDSESYSEKVERFLEEKQSVDDGNSAYRIVDWLEKIL